MRGAGLTIDARTEGVPVPLPPGLDLSAYRILQEALTNALKHAGHTSTTVRVAYQPDRLLLDVTNQPGTARPGGINGNNKVNGNNKINGGHGIIGMRERAALFGGTMQAEPQSGGGYRVQADLPLPAREPT